MKVLLAMSGGVDSSVAGALLREQGHDVVGVTMKLWGGDSDTGCCSVERRRRRPARRPAARHRPPRVQLRRRLRHARRGAVRRRPRRRRHAQPVHRVQSPPQVRSAAAARRSARLRCRRHRASRPHRARAVRRLRPRARRRRRQGSELRRAHARPGGVGAHAVPGRRDRQGRRCAAIAAEHGLRTASKPDSQDVCFITSTGGRETFLGDRIAFRPAASSIDRGAEVGDGPGGRADDGRSAARHRRPWWRRPSATCVDVDVRRRRGDGRRRRAICCADAVGVGDVAWTDRPRRWRGACPGQRPRCQRRRRLGAGEGGGTTTSRSRGTCRSGASRRARAWCSTTSATGACWAAASPR